MDSTGIDLLQDVSHAMTKCANGVNICRDSPMTHVQENGWNFMYILKIA